MANWKVKWVCQDCGQAIWSVEMPDEDDCACYREPEEEKPAPMTKDERNERYRIAYHLRGRTWAGVQAYMYMGHLATGQNYLAALVAYRRLMTESGRKYTPLYEWKHEAEIGGRVVLLDFMTNDEAQLWKERTAIYDLKKLEPTKRERI